MTCHAVLDNQYGDRCFGIAHEKNVVTQAQTQNIVQLGACLITDFCLSDWVTGKAAMVVRYIRQIQASVLGGNFAYLAGGGNNLEAGPLKQLGYCPQFTYQRNARGQANLIQLQFFGEFNRLLNPGPSSITFLYHFPRSQVYFEITRCAIFRLGLFNYIAVS